MPVEDGADTPESLKTLRNIYRSAAAKTSAERDAKATPLFDLYLNALDAYIPSVHQSR